MNPRRAWLVIAALAVTLLAVALGVATLLESRTRAFAGFRGLAIWKIDVHEQADPEVLGAAVNWAASQGILGVVNLAGGHAGGGLERQLEAARRFPGRVVVFMVLDPEGCCDAAWADRESARLVSGRSLGARGVHVPRDLAGPDGAPVPLDAPALEPVWEVVEGLGLPVAVHPGEGPDGTAQLGRLLDRRPGVRFLAAGMAGLADDPAALSALLAAHPNLLVDTAGSVDALGRRPDAARELLTTHADRVLYGSDLLWVQGPRPEQRALVLGEGPPVRSGEEVRRFFESTWRFLETRDPSIPPVRPETAGTLGGVGLPRDVLERIYRGNAQRLLGFGDLGDR